MLNGDLSQLARDYLLQACAYCKKEMKLAEGDTIYGNKWYHKECFSLIQSQLLRSNTTKGES